MTNLTNTEKSTIQFYNKFNIELEAKNKSILIPEQFQKDAINSLINWFENSHKPYSGGVMAIPTGGGKTFVSTRFLTIGPLSEGYKILWLAHTHHLLEQAYETFSKEIGHTSKKRKNVTLRVVSGTKSHYKPRDIEENDDVIFSTLQTITRAYSDNKKHPQLEKFLESSKGKLFVVFDEAHHAPAYTYRKLVLGLREKFPDMYLLGLTATPTRTDRKKNSKNNLDKIESFKDGRLKELFPQGNIYKISMDKLIALNVLAEPYFEQPKLTNFEVNLTEEDLVELKQKHKVPEKIVTEMACDSDRNEYIADTYAKNKKKYGKTIMFADRRHQCVELCNYLKKKGVKAGYIFSQGKKEKNGNYQVSDEENKRVLKDFRNGELDVLVNIRMLTEGTDVPNAKTVFLTRQTLSEILMTQMVGRVLRGPKFGGTKRAYIVPFIDEWKDKILWVPPEIVKGEIIIPPEPAKNLYVLKFISIDAINKVANDLYTGKVVFKSYLKRFMPIGWYQTEYNLSQNTDDVPVKDLIMVFEEEKESYERFIDQLSHLDLGSYRKPDLDLNEKLDEIKKWSSQFFKEETENKDILRNLFNITRHFAQNEVEPPFFKFEKREEHDLDRIVDEVRTLNLNIDQIEETLNEEYNNKDKYWNSIYPDFNTFYRHFLDILSKRHKKRSKETKNLSEEDLVKNLKNSDWKIRKESCESLLNWSKTNDLNLETVQILYNISNDDENIEVKKSAKETLRRAPRQLLPIEISFIKERDGYRCLCCGETAKRNLQVDHIKPKWEEIDNSPENLQTLCKVCNGIKGTDYINFREHEPKIEKTKAFPLINEIYSGNYPVENLESWEKFLKQKINLYYECDAVKSVKIGKRGYQLRNWEIELWEGNNEKWIEPFLNDLSKEINLVRRQKGYNGPDVIRIAK